MGFSWNPSHSCGSRSRDSPAADFQTNSATSDRLKFRDAALQFTGDIIRVVFAREADRGPYRHSHMTGSSDYPLGLLQVKQAVQTYRDNRNVQLLGKQTDSGAKVSHLAVLGGSAFRENEDVPAAVYKISCESETLQESRLLRQWKDVEEAQSKKISQPLHEAFEQVLGVCRATHFGKALAAHGSRQLVAKPRRQRRKNPGNVQICDVIGDDKHRPLQSAQILAAANAGRSEKVGRRPGE